jgi:hypothetical protein
VLSVAGFEALGKERFLQRMHAPTTTSALRNPLSSSISVCTCTVHNPGIYLFGSYSKVLNGFPKALRDAHHHSLCAGIRAWADSHLRSASITPSASLRAMLNCNPPEALFPPPLPPPPPFRLSVSNRFRKSAHACTATRCDLTCTRVYIGSQ